MITVLAPAKINLTLDVTSKLPNGYHAVEMVMQTISLYDEIIITPCSSFGFTVEGARLPMDDVNTVCKAVKLYTEKLGISPAFHVTVKKNIPMQAGLAGGSADAAGVLMGINHLFDESLTKRQLHNLGSQIGADVPFCMQGGTCFAGGIGTTLRPFPAMPDCFIAVAKPFCNVSTAQAYAAIDRMLYPDSTHWEDMKEALQTKDITAVGKSMYNRFEEVLQEPQVASLKTAMLEKGALGALMTGSGSAVIGLFTDEQTAKAALETVKPVCEMTAVCTPVNHGPKIV